MIVTLQVAQWLCVRDDAFVVNGERLVRRDNLVFAHVTKERSAVLVCRLDAQYFLVEAALVYFSDVGGGEECWRVLVDVNHGDVDRGAGW